MFKTKKIKGQIFSLDFLIAMTLLILILGVILNTTETKNIEVKEKILKTQIEEKVNVAFQTLLNTPEFNCDINKLILTNTIDKNKLLQNNQELKNMLGLTRYNIEIKINDQNITSQINYQNNEILTIEQEIFFCEKSLNYTTMDLNNCRIDNCYTNYLEKGKITLMVGK
jgi:hypothetical protein